MPIILYAGGAPFQLVRKGRPAPTGADKLDYRKQKLETQRLFRTWMRDPYNRAVITKWLRRLFSAGLDAKDTDLMILLAAREVFEGRWEVYDLPWAPVRVLAPAPAQPRPVAAAPAQPMPAPVQKVPVRLRFQICGGESAGPRITGAPWSVHELGETAPFKSGNTQTGDVEFDMDPNGKVRVHIFSTDYLVQFRSGDKIPSSWDNEGYRRAMDVLAYLTGYLRDLYPRDDPGVRGNVLDEHGQQATMNYQVDHGMAPSIRETLQVQTDLTQAIWAP